MIEGVETLGLEQEDSARPSVRPDLARASIARFLGTGEVDAQALATVFVGIIATQRTESVSPRRDVQQGSRTFELDRVLVRSHTQRLNLPPSSEASRRSAAHCNGGP